MNSATFPKTKLKYGDNLKIYSGNKDDIKDSFMETEFTIVGIIQTPIYLSKYHGATDVGSGEIKGNIFLLEQAFNIDIYTNVFIKTNIENMPKFSKEYASETKEIAYLVESIGKKRENIRYEEVYNEIQKEINDGKLTLADGERKLQDAENQLLAAKKKLDDAKYKFFTSNVEFISAISNGDEQLNSYKSDLTKADSELSIGKTELEKNKKELNNAKNILQIQQQELEKNKINLELLNSNINNLIITLSLMNTSNPEYSVLKRQLSILETQYEDGMITLANFNNELTKASLELDQNEKLLNEAEKQFNLSLEEYNLGYATLQKELNSFENIKVQTQKQLNNAMDTITDGTQTYLEKKSEFEEKRIDAKKDINEAKKDIKNAEDILNNLTSKWYVIELNKSKGFVAFENDLSKIAIMGRVFPVMFFFVAGLVSLTAITRLIEEDRESIGVFKALGYSKWTIVGKYVSYSLSATIIGIVSGVLLGTFVITQVLYTSYKILYSLPDLVVNIQWFWVVLATTFSLICNVVFAIIVSYKKLNEVPANLIRVKAPVSGKKIFLERFSWLWKHLSFNYKITFRNIFRYKRRLFMAIIGIAGCTALIYTGLSLKTSIDSISFKQFGEIKSYTMEINLPYEHTESEIQEIVDYVSNNNMIESCTYVRQKAIDVEANGEEKEIFYAVGESFTLKNYIALRDRKTGNDLYLNDNGVIISEKLSNILKAKVDDEIYVKKDNEKFKTKVIGITENYLFNFMYMTPAVYEQVQNEEITYNQIFANTIPLTISQEEELSNKLKEHDKISGITYTRVVNETYQKSLESLVSIVALFIGSAALLSFIVLFNLTSINIEERRRELATIKVLGFFNTQVSGYIFRENVIISILGGLLGLIPRKHNAKQCFKKCRSRNFNTCKRTLL